MPAAAMFLIATTGLWNEAKESRPRTSKKKEITPPVMAKFCSCERNATLGLLGLLKNGASRIRQMMACMAPMAAKTAAGSQPETRYERRNQNQGRSMCWLHQLLKRWKREAALVVAPAWERQDVRGSHGGGRVVGGSYGRVAEEPWKAMEDMFTVES
ncbi:hypothetical protein M011DRAFT_528607 [Sporormia fimetaria CBS 119925]|uniref:Uncharacterized protein n=1 Tax=Sporormia fimetaria CBS 119925 TaxID=1340428 RepID=A0A6A6V4E3_9PLEO|nr:hypothetical protein M011DRAFT_528607 [Sporormia fimetaria CBS 119925]